MKKAGIYADVSGSVMQTNGFRKRAMTKMIQAKVDYDCREYLIGHRRSRGLNVHYDRTSETERFMEWSKSINLLTIDPTNRLQQENQELRSERITKEDLEEIRKQWMIDLQKERALISLSEWNALKEQMNKLKEVLYPQK